MEGKRLTENSRKKHVRQQPSVPFIWEEKPGTPKKNWKPGTTTPPIPLPVKLVASIPFKWEEKPGIPLSPPPNLISEGSDHNDEHEMMSELDLESFGFETEESFLINSVPSLLANCLVPVQKTSSIQNSLETPSSPASETDSSTSSYVTGTSSPVGNSFLECLFPLLPPPNSSGFLDMVGNSQKGFVTPPELKIFDHESNKSVMVRRPPTLGELIMMSRRRSYHYQRKAVELRKQNLSMEFMKNGALGCCVFGSGSSKMIEGLQRKLKQLQPSLKQIM